MKPLFLILLFLSSVSIRAATINAASPERHDVTNAIGSASNGDTVAVPSGTAYWSHGYTLTKAITLQGAGATLDEFGVATNCSTVIIDGRSSGKLFDVYLVSNQVTRISQFKFLPSTNAPFEPLIVGNGTDTDGRRIRIDHCVSSNLVTSFFWPQTVYGVVDHNHIKAGQQLPIGYVKNSSQGGAQGVDLFGDASYSQADRFGTEYFIFFEDNILEGTWSGHLTGIDGSCGSRVVVRYNRMRKISMENHGAEADRSASGRAGELYMNTFTGTDGGSSVMFTRGGTWLIWSNTISGYTASATFNMLNDRSREPLFAPFGPSDGRNPWDDNNASNPFNTGTVTTGFQTNVDGVSWVVTASGESMTPNQYQGYTIRRTSGKAVTSVTRSGSTATVVCPSHGFSVGNHVSIFGANEPGWNYRWVVASVPDSDTFTFTQNWPVTTPATGTILACRGAWFAEIFTNSATHIVYNASAYYALAPYDHHLQLEAGATYEINKVDASMQQVGLGQSPAISGSVPTVPEGGYTEQSVLSPNYEWNNYREGGADVDFSNNANGGAHRIIVENTHFYNDTQKPGYTPYTYPHPLVSGGDSTPTRFSIPGTVRVGKLKSGGQ